MRLESGMTMIELMITLTLVGILMGIAVPSYRYITYSNRASSEVNALLGEMQLARSEAIKAGQFVTICPSTNGTSCLGSTTWNTGWIVFSDVNGNAAVDVGDTVIRVQKAFAVTSDQFVSDNNVQAITFNREGFVSGLPATANGYITITLHTNPVAAQWTRCLQIMTYGSLTTERVNQGSCL
jgi:type IV fimbrial biogenesis protein FimT